MQRDEFRDAIDNAETALASEWGVCDVLRMCVDRDAQSDFSWWFRPRDAEGADTAGIEGYGAYWLGDWTAENLPRRRLFLRFFERIALDEKLYLQY